MSSLSRPAHILKREKTLAIPRYYIFFDTETKQNVKSDKSIQQNLELGWACHYVRAYARHIEQHEWIYFESAVTFWDFVFRCVQPKQRTWIIARNIVFDFTVVQGWHFLHEAGYKLKFFHNNGVSVIVTVTKGSRSVVFLDSMNWFTESLAETGKRIGIPKMEIDFTTCTKEYKSRYCRNDVLIELENFKLFIKFLEQNAISRLCYTKASTAMAAYLLRHYHTPIYIHNNAEAVKLERDSYRGGRCECFYLGTLNHENYYIVDVNSLYPFVMSGNQYPVKYAEIKHGTSVDNLAETCKDASVIAKVQVETQEPVYAVKGNRTIFPIGVFDTVLTTPELKYALEHNHIKQVFDYVVYEQAEIFTSYVKTMYALRKDFASAGVREYEQLCKVMLNSLYGKFGQKAELWTKIGDCPNEPDREEMLFTDTSPHVRRLRYLLGQLFELTGYTEAFNSFPAISSHVTAYARMYLWHLMVVCGTGNYYYCDTDSLIVNEQGLENLSDYRDDTELGKLKLVETTSVLVINGLKDYITDSKTVIKGIRKNAIKISDTLYRQEQWPSFRGTLKSNDANVYVVKSIVKQLKRDYQKGIVTASGVITPLCLLPSVDKR